LFGLTLCGFFLWQQSTTGHTAQPIENTSHHIMASGDLLTNHFFVYSSYEKGGFQNTSL
jgi:hypothetical protein